MEKQANLFSDFLVTLQNLVQGSLNLSRARDSTQTPDDTRAESVSDRGCAADTRIGYHKENSRPIVDIWTVTGCRSLSEFGNL